MTKINMGVFSEIENNKADRDLRNVDLRKTDIIIEYQEPTAANNYTWYRLYASGWVEQGGEVIITSDGNAIELPIEMLNTDYSVLSLVAANINSFNRCYRRTNTEIYMASSGGDNLSNWQVCGIADMTTHHEILPNPTQNLLLQMIELIYPVGSLYMGTQTTCPMAFIIPNSTWELVSDGKALWTGDGTNANTTINAGLPNIKGTLDTVGSLGGDQRSSTSNGTGALSSLQTATAFNYGAGGRQSQTTGIKLDASKSNSIYSDSVTTVQPPAYVVNVWRRTA